MDTLPFEVRGKIISYLPEEKWGGFRAASSVHLEIISHLVAGVVNESPAVFGPSVRVFSMYKWLSTSRVPIDQKFRIVLQRMPRRGLVKYLMKRGRPESATVDRFIESIISNPSPHPYSRENRAHVLALFGITNDRTDKIAAMTGVIDLVSPRKYLWSSSLIYDAVKRGHIEVAQLFADRYENPSFGYAELERYRRIAVTNSL